MYNKPNKTQLRKTQGNHTTGHHNKLLKTNNEKYKQHLKGERKRNYIQEKTPNKKLKTSHEK